MSETGGKKRRIGIVTSDKMDKTIVVEVQRLVRHPKYEKTIRLRNKFKAHDERNEAKMGDKVEIVETRPLSKTKCWRLSQIIRKAPQQVEIVDEEEVAAEVGPKKEEKLKAAPAAEAPAEAGQAAPEKEESGDTNADQT